MEFVLIVISKITIIYILLMENVLNAISKIIMKYQSIAIVNAKKILFIIMKHHFVNQ